MVTRIFQLLLLISPIAVCADINPDIFDIIFFRTGVMVLFISSLLDKPKRQIPDYLRNLILGLFGLCLFNMYNHPFAQSVLANTLNTFIAIIGFCIVYVYYDDTKNLKKFILWAAFINLILFSMQMLGFDPVYDKSDFGMLEGGFLGNSARLANYITLIIAFLPIYLLPACIIFGLIIKQYVVFIPVIVILFNRGKTLKSKILITIVVFSASVFLGDHIGGSLKVRINEAWFPVLKAFFDRPFVGCGLGINPVPGSGLGVILNSYIQFIVGFGILGAVWFGYLFRTIYQRIELEDLTTPFVVLLLLMLIEYPVEMMRCWFLIIAILVMQLLKIREVEKCQHHLQNP